MPPASDAAADSEFATERDAAIAIAEKRAPSPLRYQNSWLYAIRITGTGVSYRAGLKEYVWRSPEVFLADEFVDRCNGLPVILIHPEKTLLNEEEYANRNVGSILYPYRQGQDVWGIARIFDEQIVEEMRSGDLSTSPGVRFTDADELASVELGDDVVTVEGTPSLLDHIAIVPAGVWDKGGPPSGIRNDSMPDTKARRDATEADISARIKREIDRGHSQKQAEAIAYSELGEPRKDGSMSETDKDCAMTDGKRKDAGEEMMDRLDSIATMMDGIGKRLDKIEKDREEDRRDGHRKDAKRGDGEEDEEKKDRRDAKREDAKRKDAKRGDGEEDGEAEEEPETERGDAKRKDAKRKDAKRGDGEEDREDAKRRDAEEDVMDKKRRDAEDDRKDAAQRENEALRRQIEAMNAKLDALVRAPDYSDIDRLAAAQTRADAALQSLGERPEKPFAGETSTSYRKRILARLKKHSAKLKDIALDRLDGEAFETIENAIYADAQEAARAPAAIKGRLIPIVTQDSTGRNITRYVGDPRVWRSQFDAPPVAFAMERPSRGIN